MKILYIAHKYDYGKKERGYSFEHYNVYDSLVNMESGSNEVIYFPVDEKLEVLGKSAMNQNLLNTVASVKPDLCFFFLFEDEIYPNIINKITNSGVITFNWFADDHFRFDNFSKYYAPNFSWVSTTDSRALLKYQNIGYKNIIKTQWACNHFLYKPAISNSIDISFVGQPHGNRRELIDYLKENGIKVDCFGQGWLRGRVSQNEMISIFSNSKINLNLTKSSGGIDFKNLGRIFIRRSQSKFSLYSPVYWRDNFMSFMGRKREQIKGRTFEIPGTGGMLISGKADNIEDYYIADKEMVFFNSKDELVEKINYYMSHDMERQVIAKAGQDRTFRDHTYEQRFRSIFKTMGL